ncbi:MAG: LCP family protein [Lapillicoccus sp.]
MSSRDPGADKVRPIPQVPRGRSEHPPAWDDVDLDSAHNGAHDSAHNGAHDSAHDGAHDGEAAWDDGYVVDTRRRRPTPTARSAPGPGQLDRPEQPAARGPRAVTRQGELYEEDADYVSPEARAGARRRPAAANGRPAAASNGGRGDGPGSREYAGQRPARPPRRRSGAKRRGILLIVLLLVLAWVGFMVWVPFNAWGHVTKVDNAPAGARPADTAGHNYLLVGSDGRDGLTPQQVQELNASGGDIGKRTDSIILVHVPEGSGKSALISIPRDSYVPIPGHGTQKINAAFAFGGGKLLTATVEQVTGIRIDGYVEIGFAGFASVVDSLGGVNVCVPFDMNDHDAAINLKKGCQVLDGPTALGYVRARKSDPRGDIGRAERQRQFLGAIMKAAVTPSTVLVPWKYKSFADASAKGLEVGQDTQLTDAARVLQTLRGVDGGDTLSLVVPIANAAYQTPNAGVAVKWNTEEALALFTMIKNDEPMTVPPAGTAPAG